jgi:hypothetical protein
MRDEGFPGQRSSPGPVQVRDDDLVASTRPPHRRGVAQWTLYGVSVALWVLASGLELGPLFGGLVWALAVRGGYVYVRRRRSPSHPFWSPWLFVIAAVCTLLAVIGIRQQENEATDEAAVARGVAEQGEVVSPIQRCITQALEDLEVASPEELSWIPGNHREFVTDLCEKANREGVLASSGGIFKSDDFQAAICVDALLGEFDKVPSEERAFTRPDFRLFSERYCEEALSRDLLDRKQLETNRNKLAALSQKVLDELISSGEVRRLR